MLVAARIVATAAMGGMATARAGCAVGVPNLKVNGLAGSVTERLQWVTPGRADFDCARTTQTQSRLANGELSAAAAVDAYAGDKLKLVGLAVQGKERAKLALVTHATAPPNAGCSA